jgi:hypothetical protein
MEKIKTYKDLHKFLESLFFEIKNDKIELKKAKELNNTAGKMLKNMTAKLDYNHLIEDKTKIEYFDV